MAPELLDCRVRLARLDEHRDRRDLPVARLMHEVNHHLGGLAVNVLLARMVKMKLRQLIALVADNEKVSASGRRVVHADGMAIVDHIADGAALVLKTQPRK